MSVRTGRTCSATRKDASRAPRASISSTDPLPARVWPSRKHARDDALAGQQGRGDLAPLCDRSLMVPVAGVQQRHQRARIDDDRPFHRPYPRRCFLVDARPAGPVADPIKSRTRSRQDASAPALSSKRRRSASRDSSDFVVPRRRARASSRESTSSGTLSEMVFTAQYYHPATWVLPWGGKVAGDPARVSSAGRFTVVARHVVPRGRAVRCLFFTRGLRRWSAGPGATT